MKNLLLILASLFLFSCASKEPINHKEIKVQKAKLGWKINSFKAPESAYYHEGMNLIFVSNVNGGGTEKNGKGYISVMSSSGKMISRKWVKGLNAPKGMRAHKGLLYVSDIDRVVAFNINNGQVVSKLKIKDSKFLNDVAVDEAGAVYVSDMFTGKIHMIKDGKEEVFLEGKKLLNPNGLYVYDNKLFVASWGADVNPKDFSTSRPGDLYSIDLKTKKITTIVKGLGNLDGLERTRDGNFITSDWVKGKVYKVFKDTTVSTIYEGKTGTADIGYISRKQLILIPQMNKNFVQSINL